MLYLLVSVGFIRGATSDDQGLLNFESLVNLVKFHTYECKVYVSLPFIRRIHHADLCSDSVHQAHQLQTIFPIPFFLLLFAS